MQFKNIIGHQNEKQQLIQAVRNNRLSHANLFVGKKGVGKLPMAIAFAQYISCSNKKEDDSCGVCASCIKYQKLAHPDLHFVFPVVKNKGFSHPVSDNFINEWRTQVNSDIYFDIDDWYNTLGVENSQGMIYTEESNEIIKKLSLKSYESEYKIMIIWLPEKMNVSCANKLLKMIEEPPHKTLFMMVAEEPDKLLKTILSRTQMIKIPTIDKTTLYHALKEEYQLGEEELTPIVHQAEGSYKKACMLIKNRAEDKVNFDKFVEIMRHCYARKVLDIMAWAEDMGSRKMGRERQKGFLNYAIKMIRENFILNLNQPEMSYMSGDELQFSTRFSPFINEENVWAISDELTRAYTDIERNGNAQIIFLDLGLKLVKLLRP